MQPYEHHVAILFADVCDSVPLYEAFGDAGAFRTISRRLDDLAVLATHFGGRVVRSKGDDVLSRIQVTSAAVTFLEQSSAVSWLLDGDGKHVNLQRESRALEGEGIIRLARSPHDPKPAPEVAFSVRWEVRSIAAVPDVSRVSGWVVADASGSAGLALDFTIGA